MDKNGNPILNDDDMPTTYISEKGLLFSKNYYEYNHSTKSYSAKAVDGKSYSKAKRMTFMDLWVWATTDVAIREIDKRLTLLKDGKLGFVTEEQKDFILKVRGAVKYAINHGIDSYNPDPPEIRAGEDFIVFVPDGIVLPGEFKVKTVDVPITENEQKVLRSHKFMVLGGRKDDGTDKSALEIEQELCEVINLARREGYPLPVNPKWSWIKKDYDFGDNVTPDGVVKFVMADFKVVDSSDNFYKKAEKQIAKWKKDDENENCDNISTLTELSKIRYEIERNLSESPVHYEDILQEKALKLEQEASLNEIKKRSQKIMQLFVDFSEVYKEKLTEKTAEESNKISGVHEFFGEMEDAMSLALMKFAQNYQSKSWANRVARSKTHQVLFR